jgi:plasmid stabilization system protein ParE
VSFRVRLTRDAEADLECLFDFVLEPELARASGNLDLADQFGRSGYLALFEIVGAAEVVVSAVRHQLEDDYH